MFRSKRDSAPAAQPATTSRSGTLFGRNRTPSPVRTEPARTGLFGRRRNSSSSSDNERDSRHGRHARHSSSVNSRTTRSGGVAGFFNRDSDPVISDARGKVSDAEAAERAADQALIAARQAVIAAKQHVKDVVTNSERDARAAKLRHTEAKGVAKDANSLGRFN